MYDRAVTPDRTKISLRVFSLLVISCAMLVCGPECSLRVSEADDSNVETNNLSFSGRRRYVHPCPGGTEPVGKSPPEGKRMFCRQPIVGGYRKHGTYTTWYHNGQPRIVGEYYAGKRHGIWSYYHRNGSLKAKITYQNDKKTEHLVYDAHGKAKSRQEIKEERAQRRAKGSWRSEIRSKKSKARKRRFKDYSWKGSGGGGRRKVKLFKW